MVVMPAASAPTAAPVAISAATQATQPFQDLKKSLDELQKEQNQIRKTLEELKRSREASVSPTQTPSELLAPQRGKILPEKPAHITVRLPADAKLTVDGVDCPLTSDTRTFDTPALAPGKKYYYLLKAEVVRGGRTIAQTRQVDFRPGERVTVSFENLGANLVSTR